jgi:hypothetical protein
MSWPLVLVIPLLLGLWVWCVTRIRREYRTAERLAPLTVGAVWVLYLVHASLTLWVAWLGCWSVPLSWPVAFGLGMALMVVGGVLGIGGIGLPCRAISDGPETGGDDGGEMSVWSVVLGVLGVCGSGVWILVYVRRGSAYEPQRAWLIGLAALFPAWLLAFLGLLEKASGLGSQVSLPHSALWSSGAGVLGVVLTDAAVRRLPDSGRMHPLLPWLLGVIGLVPAWGLALLAL